MISTALLEAGKETRCDVCGEPLQYVGSDIIFDGDGDPVEVHVYDCPSEHGEVLVQSEYA